MTEAVAMRTNPAPALEAAYCRAQATRMAGLPFLNGSLAVEAIGFAPWQAHWLGVVVTPWFMNLVVAPRDAAQWRALPAGEKRRFRFPASPLPVTTCSASILRPRASPASSRSMPGRGTKRQP